MEQDGGSILCAYLQGRVQIRTVGGERLQPRMKFHTFESTAEAALYFIGGGVGILVRECGAERNEPVGVLTGALTNFIVGSARCSFLFKETSRTSRRRLR